MELPRQIEGNSVIEYGRFPTKLRPNGYTPSAEGTELEAVDLVAISVGEGADGKPVYWVTYLDDRGEEVTGDMYYTLESARSSPETEYGVSVNWVAV